MKRVLIITYYWPPSGGAGVQRWLKFSKFLPEFGWEPVILTVDPEKATFPVLDKTLLAEVNPNITVVHTDSREWFSFYQKASGSDKVPYAGFANERKSPSLKQKLARFVRGNFFLPDPRKGWNKAAVAAAKTILNEGKIDCIITTSPPHSTQLIGYKLAQEYNIPWIADFRDPWTDIYYYKQFYPTIFAHRKNLKTEKNVLEKADAVITVGPTLQNLFANKIESNKDKIKVLTNGYDPDDFQSLPPKSSSKFVITYVGTLADIYPLDHFLTAFKRLIENDSNALFRCIGTISPQQREKIMQLPEENIELIQYVNHRTAIEYMSSSSCLLLIIPSNPNNKGIITGKIFEYIAVGRPIVFLGPTDGDGATIIREGKAGAVINYNNDSEIYETLIAWSKQLPTIEIKNSFSRKSLTQSLSVILDELTPNN